MKNNRRHFLQSAAAVTGGALLAGIAGSKEAQAAVQSGNLPPDVPSWMKKLGTGVEAAPYGEPVKYERDVIRRNVPFLTATTESSVSFTPLQDLDGVITPNGLCFVRDHGGTPVVDPVQHRLMIHGLVERPMVYSMVDLMRFPTESRIYFTECAANGGMDWRGAQMQGVQFSHGMVHCCEWTGVKLSTLMNETGVSPKAKWMLAEGADAAAMTRSIPIEKAADDVLVAWSQNGERLRAENGYPLRLVVPGWQANTSVKWLRRLKFGEEPWETREETSKYTELMADGKALQFTWAMLAKSVITRPCPEKPLAGKGFCEVSGLAWSGLGKVKRVDVSFDGGANWAPASLQEPVLTKSLTRFRIPWEWNGQLAYLQSRVIDETGYIQPTIVEMRKAWGSNAVYHKNAIYTWRVNQNGTVDSVEVN
ncbi:sulfite dehydrogenase [bacterium]|nr:MAG: sulfite dehydrogenase [bacterium]